MKALITGHRGFIGRHLHAALTEVGWEVDGVDLVDGDDCRDFFRDDRSSYDLAVHCAAIVGGRARIEGDPLAVATNMGLDVDAFRWALKAQVGRFVYWSSSAVYPIALQQRGQERQRLHPDFVSVTRPKTELWWLPDQTYGWAKLTGEMLAHQARSEGLRVDIYRPFSGYGEDQSLDYPFPSFIARAKRREDPFTIWGDGTQVRDWVHVDDIVDAVFAGLGKGPSMAPLGVGPSNICTGVGTSFIELARMVTADYEPEIACLIDRPVGVHYRVGHLAGRPPPKIDLADGIRRALATGDE